MEISNIGKGAGQTNESRTERLKRGKVIKSMFLRPQTFHRHQEQRAFLEEWLGAGITVQSESWPFQSEVNLPKVVKRRHPVWNVPSLGATI